MGVGLVELVFFLCVCMSVVILSFAPEHVSVWRVALERYVSQSADSFRRIR